MTEPIASARRAGLWSPPVVDAIDSRAILGDIEGREYVPLHDFAQRIGWTDTGQKYAVRAGLITPERIPHAAGLIASPAMRRARCCSLPCLPLRRAWRSPACCAASRALA